MLRLRSKIKVQRGKLMFGQRNRRTSRSSSYWIIGQKLWKYGAIFECRTFRNFIRQIFHSATHQSEKNSFNKNTIRKLTKGKQLFNCIIKQLDHSVGSTELRTVKARQIVRTTNSANRCEHCSVEPAIRQIFKWKIFHLESWQLANGHSVNSQIRKTDIRKSNTARSH